MLERLIGLSYLPELTEELRRLNDRLEIDPEGFRDIIECWRDTNKHLGDIIECWRDTNTILGGLVRLKVTYSAKKER